MGFSGIMKYLLLSEEWSAVLFPHSERKNILWRHTLCEVDRIDRGDSPFSPRKQPLSRCFISIYYLGKSLYKKEYNRAIICQPVALNFICSSILSTLVNVCQRTLLESTHRYTHSCLLSTLSTPKCVLFINRKIKG